MACTSYHRMIQILHFILRFGAGEESSNSHDNDDELDGEEELSGEHRLLVTLTGS